MRAVLGALVIAALCSGPAAAQVPPGSGIAFAKQWFPWVLDPNQVAGYLQALKQCQAGDVRYCKAVDMMLPAVSTQAAQPDRCLSVPIGDGSFATRCF